MLKTITNLSTNHSSNHQPGETILALRSQRLEQRLAALEPCLFKHAALLEQKRFAAEAAKQAKTSTTTNNQTPYASTVKLKI